MTHDVQGIYQIKNLKNDKVYIGSSVCVYKRWQQHRRELRSNKHHSFHLQQAWNKYGEDSFKFSILETVPNNLDLLDRETHFVVETKSISPQYGYNTDLPKDTQKRIELRGIDRNFCNNEHIIKAQPIVQVDIQTGNILFRFKNRIELRDSITITLKRLEYFLENNTFQARSQKKSRLLHPFNDTILMYEKYYKPDFDYKSAIKVGELVEVVRGSYREVLTRYEFQDLLGREVNDYTWPKLRSISYKEQSSNKEGKVDYEGFTLTFLRKSVRDETRTLKTKAVDIKENREIVAIKDGEIIKTYHNSKEMTIDLGIDHKHTLRLLAKSNGKKGKKRRQGFLYYYKDQL